MKPQISNAELKRIIETDGLTMTLREISRKYHIDVKRLTRSHPETCKRIGMIRKAEARKMRERTSPYKKYQGNFLRNCLKCDMSFEAESKFYRLCKTCRGSGDE